MGLFTTAQRKKAKLRLAISGPSGSGKTYSALLIAKGIVPLSKVAVIDTESGSADLYANLGNYSTLTMSPPYEPHKYIEAIKAAEKEGFELVIIDSLSHAWNGEGGLLDQQGKATTSKYKGNSWAAWREVTPLYNQLVETILHSNIHVIATMRSKTEYVQSNENGRKKIEKVGTAPVQRDGIEYEFTTVFDLSQDHIATISKDRTKLFDGKYFIPTEECGRALLNWLNGGEAQPEPVPQPMPVQSVGSKQPIQQPIEQPTAQPPQSVPVAATTQSEQPDIPPTQYYLNRMKRIYKETGWDKTSSFESYFLQRLKQKYGPNVTMQNATLDDYAAIDQEMTNYLQSANMGKIAEVRPGELPF